MKVQILKHLSKDESLGRGGKKCGKAAGSKAPSAYAIAKLLTGIDFPKHKGKVIELQKKIK